MFEITVKLPYIWLRASSKHYGTYYRNRTNIEDLWIMQDNAVLCCRVSAIVRNRGVNAQCRSCVHVSMSNMWLAFARPFLTSPDVCVCVFVYRRSLSSTSLTWKYHCHRHPSQTDARGPANNPNGNGCRMQYRQGISPHQKHIYRISDGDFFFIPSIFHECFSSLHNVYEWLMNVPFHTHTHILRLSASCHCQLNGRRRSSCMGTFRIYPYRCFRTLPYRTDWGKIKRVAFLYK